MTLDHPTSDYTSVGWLTEAQMAEVDRIMIEDLHIELVQMMENAGRNLAQLAIDRFHPQTATVLVGSGGNGGGGLVAARHLHNRGVDVCVTMAKPAERLATVPAHQYDILERLGTAIDPEPRRSDLVIDAMIGYSLNGAPRGRVAELIEWSGHGQDAPVAALDTPSGLNVTGGSAPGDAVIADITMTLALPKVGLRGAPQVGELYLADISVPPSVYEAIGTGPPPDFTRNSIIRLIDPTADNAS